MSRTLLVTGGAGYIGSHMAKILSEEGNEVVIIDNLSRGNESAARYGTLYIGDIDDPVLGDHLFTNFDIDAVMHFAAFAYVGESVENPDIYYRNNVQGTLGLLDVMNRHGVRNLVFSSTCATYGIPEHLPITEDSIQNPINPYGKTKLMMENILSDYAVAYGLRSISLRYFNAAGCASDGSLGEQHDPETHLIPLVLFEAQRIKAGGDPADSTLQVFGDDFNTRDGTCVRDYIHVEDLCRAHLQALDRLFNAPEFGAEQFNLGTNRGVSVLEVIQACSKIANVDIPFKRSQRRVGDPPELVADATRAMNVLDWEPRFKDIESSIQHAWRWIEKNKLR